MNFPGPVFCSSYHEFVQSNGRVSGLQKKGLKVLKPKRGDQTEKCLSLSRDLSSLNPKRRPKKRDELISYLLLNEVLHTSLTMKLFDPKLMKKFLWLQWLMVFLVEFHTRVDLLTVLTYLGKLGALNSTARTKECKHRGASKTSEKK